MSRPVWFHVRTAGTRAGWASSEEGPRVKAAKGVAWSLKGVTVIGCNCDWGCPFILHGWREGRWGALRMGASHGLFCIGCCWGLRVVLFAVGLMNLGWMIGLTLVMSVEKLSDRGLLIGRAFGALLVGAGIALRVAPDALRGLV